MKLVNAVADFFKKYPHDTLILTPNKRLGRFMQRQYALYQQAQSVTAWRSLSCLSMNAWLQRLWDSLNIRQMDVTSSVVLTASQETLLWQTAVNRQKDVVELFNPTAAADVARSAWSTLKQWQVEIDKIPELHPAFEAWANEYRALCDEKSLIDFTSMVELLTEVISRSQLRLPSNIVLLAFDDIPPQLVGLLEATKNQGAYVHYEELYSFVNQDLKQARHVNYIGLANYQTEIWSAACWAANLIDNNPMATVGVVIPELNQSRAQVERIFTQVFEPQYVLPDQARHAPGFNISAAVPLAKVPLVASALLLLKLNFSELSTDDVSQLLHSPFFGNASEMQMRSQLDKQLREQNLSVSFKTLSAMIGEFPGKSKKEKQDDEQVSYLTSLHSGLQNFRKLLLHAPKEQAPTAWAQLFAEQLIALGWPGERALDTLEYQQLEIWYSVIANMSNFDHVYPAISLAKAIDILSKLANDTAFQAQTKDSPVQVLGVFEAAGMMFDHLWIMNMDNASWPAAVKPNPLLPLSMQKSLQMPRASAERELLLAKRLTSRFANSAQKVIFSYAMLDGDKAMQPSSLLTDYHQVTLDELNLMAPADYCNLIMHNAQLERVIDIKGVAVGERVESNNDIRGGTQILKDQAACPFRAYAKHRLFAREDIQAQPGLNAADRGSLIHDALERIWKHIKDHSQLLNMSDKSLKEVINNAIDSSINDLKHNKSIGLKLGELEHSRMYKLLRAWLELEKKRSPFSVVFREAKQDIALTGLPINVRYDRVDKLEDGRLFVIDYKTGKSEARTWSGERPDEPQVPIYGVANEDNIAGVAFGQLHVDEVAFKGIAERDNIAPGLRLPDNLGNIDLPDSWQDIITHWREVLYDLSREFLAGHAEVKPKHGAVTCQYCNLQSLCRIRELEYNHKDGDLES
ncbi:PD-(D/E)XK nuclease family protein [Agarilytica rhodophyticola]|uniref:PD-(D/E)XK nuclease family protein n=1 Tax=Agarilytica rhodophyticola TaxID=1737490 RepID=UPI000B341F2D|nr:PD-(D/E)XK nuclease family protein [Agarilytica rhodophyticola]